MAPYQHVGPRTSAALALQDGLTGKLGTGAYFVGKYNGGNQGRELISSGKYDDHAELHGCVTNLPVVRC